MFHPPLLPPLIKERMKNNNNLKSFFPPLKASSNSSVIDLRQKTNLASPTPQASVLVSQPPSSSFLPPFSVLLLLNLYQYNKFPNMRILSWNINGVYNNEKLKKSFIWRNNEDAVKWPGVWRRKEWAGEGKKERKEREKKEREKSKANYGKDWWCIVKENQPSKFIPFTNKQKEYSYGTTNIISVELTRSKIE